MTAIFFDTLLFSQALRDSGMNEKTANVLAEEVRKIEEKREAATKEEVVAQKNIVGGDIATLRNEMHQEFKLVRNEMQQEFKLVRSEMKTIEQGILKEIKNTMFITVVSLGTIIALIEKFF
jgi:hypothetical protein